MQSRGRLAAAFDGSLRIARVMLGISGVVAGHMTAPRYVSIVGSYALYFVLKQHASLAWAAGYFLAATLVHYVYLFGMFRPGGWSRALRRRSGEEGGFRLHESWMAFVFCHNALSIGFMCYATQGLPVLGGSLPAMPLSVRWVVAVALTALGLGAKIWATLVVRLDAYYYRDLFLERATGSLERRGPYRYFDDPMYTVGHLQAYGLALLAASTWGVLAVAVNQALVLTFNQLVEQPHMRRIRRASAETSEPAFTRTRPSQTTGPGARPADP
jgi:protein-S-isoprenylcysteine O-methyltransferase Ste14